MSLHVNPTRSPPPTPHSSSRDGITEISDPSRVNLCTFGEEHGYKAYGQSHHDRRLQRFCKDHSIVCEQRPTLTGENNRAPEIHFRCLVHKCEAKRWKLLDTCAKCFCVSVVYILYKYVPLCASVSFCVSVSVSVCLSRSLCLSLCCCFYFFFLFITIETGQ